VNSQRVYPEILNEVVEHAEALRVFAVRNVDKGADFCGLAQGRVRRSRHERHQGRTSKEMWSFPTRISSSCLPTMFFFGQFVSSSLRGSRGGRQPRARASHAHACTHLTISLDSIIRFISLTTFGPIHTVARISAGGARAREAWDALSLRMSESLR
jgi:hypothetical protein